MKLAVRTASGVVFLLVFGGALLLGLPYLAILLTALLALGLWEYRQVSRRAGVDPPLLILVPLSVFWLWRFAYPRVPSLSIGLEAALLVGLSLVAVRAGAKVRFAGWASALAGAVWLGFGASFVLLIFNAEPGRVRSIELVLLTVGVSVISDTLAYLLGSWVGKHPLAPAVSPNKTWEGAVAGWAGATVAFCLLLPAVLPGVGYGSSLLIGGLAAVAAQLGDLAESAWKREMGVKDSGSLLPGHGGILDRVDSVLFVGVVVYSLLGAMHAL